MLKARGVTQDDVDLGMADAVESFLACQSPYPKA
jgi:hypothetical protein